jgi:hypothetical protein
MWRERYWLAIGVTVLAASMCFAAPVSTWESAANLTSLSQPILNDDLINGIIPLLNPQLAAAFAPDYNAINNMGSPCVPSPIFSPNDGITGFHSATSPPCLNGSCLTDGQAGAGVDSVLSDNAYPSAVFQFDLPVRTDIGAIHVFAANPGNDGRVFQDYDVEVSTDENPDPTQRIFTPLITQVLSADIVIDPISELPTGLSPNGNDGSIGATLTVVNDDSSPTLAAGVTSIRFTFWAVSNTSRGFYDRWLGTTGPDGCPNAIPDPEDIDGNKRAFEASIIKEIDVLPPAGPACHTPPQDVNGDGDVDLTDFLVFQTCFNGPNRPYAGPPAVQGDCACLDADHDSDVDLTDFLAFQSCFNGPNRPPACP